jgi:hypothetical protein
MFRRALFMVLAMAVLAAATRLTGAPATPGPGVTARFGPGDPDAIVSQTSFEVRAPFRESVARIRQPGEVGRTFPHVKKFSSRRVPGSPPDAPVYRVHEQLVPFDLPGLRIPGTSIDLLVTVDRTRIEEGRFTVRWEMDPQKRSRVWERLDGVLEATDVDGSLIRIELTTTTKSRLVPRSRLRRVLDPLALAFARRCIGEMRDAMATWLATAPGTASPANRRTNLLGVRADG